MPSKCKPSTQILPATCAWILLLTCTAIFFGCASEFFALQYSPAILVYEGLLSIFVVVNFGLATFMDPGSYPRALEDEVKARTGDQRAPLYKSVDIDGIVIRMKWCATCQFYRPPRCSHCSVCDVCIEVFDHHCPWVNNCIGRSNYRFFFQFLLSLTCDMLSLVALSLTYIISNKDRLVSANNILLIIVIVIIGITCLPVIGLTFFHIILISKGKTTNEQVTGKLKGDHNPFDRGCFLNFQYALCGPLWPRLTGRKRKSTTLDGDSIRLIYQSNVNRVYLESGSSTINSTANGIKSASTQPAKQTNVSKDLSVTIDSHVEHSTPFSSPRITTRAVPRQDPVKSSRMDRQDLDDVPLGGSAHSMTARSHSTYSLSGQPQLSGPSIGMFSSSRPAGTSTRDAVERSAGRPGINSTREVVERSAGRSGSYSTREAVERSSGSGQSGDAIGIVPLENSQQSKNDDLANSRAIFNQHGKPSSNGYTISKAGVRPHISGGSTKRKAPPARKIDGEMIRQAPIAVGEELTPSPTVTGFELSGVGGTSLVIAAGSGTLTHTTSATQRPSTTTYYRSSGVGHSATGRPGQVGPGGQGRSRVEQRTDQSGSAGSSWKKKPSGKVKPVSNHGAAYVNYTDGVQEVYRENELDETVTTIGSLPGSIRRPRSFARALEGGDQLPASPRQGSREGLESLGEEAEELDESHPSILEISV